MIAALATLLVVLLAVLLALQFLAWLTRPVLRLIAVFCGLLLLLLILAV